MTRRDEATERQVQAARPDSSTWLAANAGSGKTRVLTDRVARLLLGGAQPQNILCLTYTKAAASEMQNRLFDRLGRWAMLGDRDLAGALEALGEEGAVSPDRLRHARTLFARAIEAPGGLKIQTIHSFCASLLRRFPLEAGVSPGFTEMEDRAARRLREDILTDFASGPERGLLDGIARFTHDQALDDLLLAILGQREAFAAPADRDLLLRHFELPAGFDSAALLGEVFLGGEAALLRELAAALPEGGATDIAAAGKLAGISALNTAALPILENLLLTGGGAKQPFAAKIGKFPTKSIREARPELIAPLEALMLRVEAARPRRLALAAVEKSLALHAFAGVFLPEYERRKQVRGWLDFDDQIGKARRLLSDPAVAAWVLYRLDGGIDHILVDEAQDTSPAQWDVIEKLAQEFFSGQGARPDLHRTLFVVGDKKQSIYSFQGADPDAFDRMRLEFQDRAAAAALPLETKSLEFSFRSAETILRLVDCVFDERASAGFSVEEKHRAFKGDLPGRVDLWPAIPPVADDEDGPWTDPVDRPGARHHAVILADRIARTIRRMIDERTPIPDTRDNRILRRPVRAGDVMILVQRRSELFNEIIRACKAEGLPIAGADRLKVGAELAVKDLAAFLRFLATPEDDLSLATALKSPLFGWGEARLFQLAHGRGGAHLWEVLRRDAQALADTVPVLGDLLDQTDFLRPFELIERILTRHDGRRRLLGRLGAEAEDGIDALLAQALAYEKTEVPCLTGFLSWMEAGEFEIKRQMGSAGDMVRVMTVHGAKGLESPIVILPDTAKRRIGDRGALLMSDGLPLWRTAVGDLPPRMAALREAEQHREANERLRLLYVAMTRAEKWLIVAAAGDLDKQGDDWFQTVEAGLREAGAVTHDFEGGPGLRLQDPRWSAPELDAPSARAKSLPDLPDMFRRAAPPVTPARAVLTPSDLGGAKALPGPDGEDEETAKRRGTHIHLLLEHLGAAAPEDWEAACEWILPEATPAERSQALRTARQVLAAPALQWLFAPGVLAEVPITGEIGARRMQGVIDRLAVAEREIHVVDFKSNLTVPRGPADCPEGLLRQMGAYVAVLKEIFPGRAIRPAILWTHTASLMELPQDLVMSALRRTPHLDLPSMTT